MCCLSRLEWLCLCLLQSSSSVWPTAGGRDEGVVGPQDHAEVPGRASEVDADVDQAPSQPETRADGSTSRLRSWAVRSSLATQNTQPTRCPSCSAIHAALLCRYSSRP